MAESREPVFLERESYRRRRIGDAGRLLPVMGLVLMMVPALWASEHRTAEVGVYIFTVWAFLIVLVAVLSRHLSKGVRSEQGPSSDVAGGGN